MGTEKNMHLPIHLVYSFEGNLSKTKERGGEGGGGHKKWMFEEDTLCVPSQTTLLWFGQQNGGKSLSGISLGYLMWMENKVVTQMVQHET